MSIRKTKISEKICEDDIWERAFKVFDKWTNEKPFSVKRNQSILENIDQTAKRTIINTLSRLMIFVFPIWIFQKIISQIIQQIKKFFYKRLKLFKYKKDVMAHRVMEMFKTWNLKWANL